MRIESFLIGLVLLSASLVYAAPNVPPGEYCAEGRLLKENGRWTLVVNSQALSEVRFHLTQFPSEIESDADQEVRMHIVVDVACSKDCQAKVKSKLNFLEPNRYPRTFNPATSIIVRGCGS